MSEHPDRIRALRVLGVILLGGWWPWAAVAAEVITLNNGMQLRGRLTRVTSLNENPLAPPPSGNVDVAKIVMVDDQLRRTFVSSNQVRADGLAADGDVGAEEIKVPKRVAQVGRRIGSVGPILEVTPFDEVGNRIFSMQSLQGRIDVVQGITLVTPLYAKVEGLLVANAFVWDMRISTSSIPRDLLNAILMRQIKRTDSNDRLRLVSFYIQAERYQDALIELEQLMKDFPDLKELEGRRQRLNQLVATDVIREIEYRAAAGQHQLARNLLPHFPRQDVAGELLLKVNDLLADYEKVDQRRDGALALLAEAVAAMASHRQQAQIAEIAGEIQRELNANSLNRMADFLRLAADPALGPDQKLALAISGWLLGSGSAIDNLAESLALVEVRAAVREYLRATTEVECEEILRRLRELEGGSPANVAKIVATMNPPLDVEMPADGVPGLAQLHTPGVGEEGDARYFIQLPPEYDPARRYPCIVTLHGARSTPLDQIDWWAGPSVPGTPMRVGQATRHGYIVLAPQWARERQVRYEYAAREAAIVLRSLRDACRRFSIDTDRVFLTGHSMGADAAWDIGLAHPDLWAGVLPITGVSDKYVPRYWKNARGLPMYFVAGQMDGTKTAVNARDIDRYLKYAGYDVTYVEYQGRGDEHFSDEILRLFDWMNRYRRDVARKEFEATAMRPWDRAFWWVELDGYPEKLVVLPENWPQPKAKDAETGGSISATNGIRVKTPALGVTVWLAPEFVDFARPISFEGRRIDVTPSVDVLLSDVRTRADRQHPYWAKYRPTAPRGR